MSVMVACFGFVLSTPAPAQTIRKIFDEKGVPYFTNQPPEDDRPQRPASAASAHVVSVTTDPKPDLVPKPLPANPSQALGDWPPRSLQVKPVPAK